MVVDVVEVVLVVLVVLLVVVTTMALPTFSFTVLSGSTLVPDAMFCEMTLPSVGSPLATDW